MRSRLWGWLIALVVICALLAGAYHVWMQYRYPVRGIDVSHHNGSIDWVQVKDAGYAFAYLKATEGSSLVDDTYAGHYAAAGDAGVLRGAYHYFLPDLDAEAQAQHFLKTAHPVSGDLVPVLDVEETRGVSGKKIRAGVNAWLDAVEKALGVRPILYTMPSFARDNLNETQARSPLWIASLRWLEPDMPADWPSWTFWQHSHSGTVPGITEKTDLNYYNGAFHDLEHLRIP